VKSPSRSTWFLWLLVLLGVVASAAFLFLPKLVTGDFAEITIDAVTPTGPGEVEIRYRGRISTGTWLSTARPWDSFRSGFEAKPGLSSCLGRARPLAANGGASCLMIYSIRDDQGRLAGPDDARDRISLKPGQSYLVRPSRPACIYRYTTSEGESTELSFKVGSY
jgi:hypothetical protein